MLGLVEICKHISAVGLRVINFVDIVHCPNGEEVGGMDNVQKIYHYVDILYHHELLQPICL
jgi:hypothetical protein